MAKPQSLGQPRMPSRPIGNATGYSNGAQRGAVGSVARPGRTRHRHEPYELPLRAPETHGQGTRGATSAGHAPARGHEASETQIINERLREKECPHVRTPPFPLCPCLYSPGPLAYPVFPSTYLHPSDCQGKSGPPGSSVCPSAAQSSEALHRQHHCQPHRGAFTCLVL